MQKSSNIIWGLVLIVLGIIFGLNALELTNINVFFPGWWTLFIIIPSFVGLITESEKTWSLITLIIGVVLLLGINNKVSFELVYKLLLPTILIIIGFSLLMKDTISKKLKDQLEHALRGKDNYSVTFAEEKKTISSEFKGCELDAVFGTIELDLTDAEIKQDCVIKTSAIFGSILIRVPKEVKVETLSTSILGSTDNNKKGGTKPTIFVEAFNLFGGTDIK